MNEFLKDDRRFLPCGGGSRLFLLADFFLDSWKEMRKFGGLVRGSGGVPLRAAAKVGFGAAGMSVVGKKEEKNFASIWKVY